MLFIPVKNGVQLRKFVEILQCDVYNGCEEEEDYEREKKT